MDATFTAILENAKRLLDDAQALAARDSFRSAMSLAVLSLEESGKACLVRWKKAGRLTDEIKDDIRTMHIAKQRVLATYKGLQAIRSVAVIKRKEEITAEQWASEDQGLNDLVRTTLADSLVVPKAQAEVGLLDHFKQCGFYVDVDENLEAVPPAVPATQEWYDALREDAVDGIRMAESDEADHAIMAIMYVSLGKPSLFGRARREALSSILASIRTQVAKSA